MKTVFIVISKEIIRRNILDTEFWPTYLQSCDTDQKTVLVVNQDSVSDYQSYVSDEVEVVGYQKKRLVGFQSLLNFFIRTTLYSHSVETYRRRAFARGQCSLFSLVLKSLISKSLGRSFLFKNFLRFIFLKSKGDVEIGVIFDKYNPQGVFTPSMIDNEFDAQFARVAKQRKIKLIGMVRSWDNFNNHGLLAVVPDVLYLQNEFLFEAAEKFQAINLKKLNYHVVGLPHYDDYYNPSGYIKNKEEFFDSMGLDINKKLIFLGGSDFYYSEDSLPKILNDSIESGDVSEAQVIFRPHPSSIFDLEDYSLGDLRHIILDDAFRGGKFKDKEKFINLLFYSDVVINIASTLSIDAAVFNKPAICINFDNPAKKLSKYEKTTALYTNFDHYERLVSTGGVKISNSSEELIMDINEAFDIPSTGQEGRNKIVETFVAPFDGSAGMRLAKQLRLDYDKV